MNKGIAIPPNYYTMRPEAGPLNDYPKGDLRVLSLFDGGIGVEWTRTSGTSATDDTTYHKTGSAGIRVIDSAGFTAMYKDLAVDLSRFDALFARFYVTDITKISYIGFYLYNDAGYTTGWGYAATGSGGKILSGWNEMVLPLVRMSAIGTNPTWHSIVRIRVIVAAVGGQTANVLFDEWDVVRSQLERGAVVVTFDDPHITVLSEAAEYMDKYRMAGVNFVNIGGVAAGANWMTWDQVRTLQNVHRWEIGYHSYSHDDLRTLTDEQVHSDARRSLEAFRKNDISRPCSGAYPQGGFSGYSNVVDITTRYFDVMRTAVSTEPYSPYPFMSRGQLCCYSVNPGDSVATITALIDIAAYTRMVLVLLFHTIDATGYPVANFKSVIDYLYGADVDVLTLRELLNDNPAQHREPVRSIAPQLSGWTALARVGSGVESSAPLFQRVSTGVTASSQAGLYTDMYGLGIASGSIDFDRELDIEFDYTRTNSDTESIFFVQLKAAASHSILTAAGLGVRIGNFGITGESYGAARSSTAAGTLTADRTMRIRIHHLPGKRVDFYLDGKRQASLTTVANIPSGIVSSMKIVHTGGNGATGGVDALGNLSGMMIKQR